MLKDTWLLGRGPGAYALDYPNMRGLGTYVDRPHDLYMQMAHQFGGIAASFFVLALGWFFWKAWEALADQSRGEEQRLRLAAVMAGLAGYGLSGLATDSNIGVAPIFWILWGTGFALLKEKANA